METEENKVLVVDGATPTKENAIINILDKGDDIILMAESAERKVTALKKIMTACLQITTPFDWVLIGGKPYLQESGCTKIANLIGVSFEIVPGFPTIECDERGYKTFTYRVRAFSRNTYVEGEGQRSMKDEFFTGKGENKKQPEQINERDVRIAALTNAKANAIKSIVPGLKNIEVETLKQAGLATENIKGYDFKNGSKGGKTGNEEEFKCEKCGKAITGNVASYSRAHFSNHVYCVNCQTLAARAKAKVTGEFVEPYDASKED